MPAPRVPNHLSLPALTRQEVQLLLDAAAPSFARPFFSLLYATGLRLSEACHLQVPDLDPKV
ncbi:MAG: tyrosine-type recombinase/integrase, partial [Deltaproteobacteria bacterium]|nr:tyrosine-type recombinase/integrase [Deltaproteobacteria bacterium]